MNKILVVISTLFITLICNAQEEADQNEANSNQISSSELAGKVDTIYTRDGLHLPAYQYTRNDTTREIQYLAPKQLAANSYKLKSRNMQYEEIFLIKKATGQEDLFYHPDSTNNEMMSVDEMKYFLNGVCMAKQQYKARGAMAAGFGVGVVSVMATPFIGLNLVYTPLLPAAYTGAFSLTEPDATKIVARNPEQSKNQEFMLGYREEAKRRRIVNTIIGACVGLISTAAIVYVIDGSAKK